MAQHRTCRSLQGEFEKMHMVSKLSLHSRYVQGEFEIHLI